jgi:FMN-dependent oxidoreductase (nitrilotriacetate monooxygenase family)
MTAPRKMNLGLFMVQSGIHVASWLDPSTPLNASSDLGHYIRMTQTAERGKFDFVFEADTPAIPTDNMTAWSRSAFFLTKFEPMTLIAVLSTVTKRIGLGATMSTSFNEPYNIARFFASLDLISGGRGGWNVVTTASDYAARNFGMPKLPSHDERYERAREFVAVVKALWDTYDGDAFIRDRKSALYIDPEKFHVLKHQGKYFSVQGALASERSPQGQPVIFQAGVSDAGRELAAETADAVFGSADTLAKAQALYKDIKGRMAKHGRAPEELKLLPGLSLLLADSQQEAEDKYQTLQELIHPDVMRQFLGEDLEIDLTNTGLDQPLTEDMLPSKGNAHEAYFNYLSNIIRTQKPTLRQLYFMWSARGRNTFRGTPAQAADLMEQFFVERGADGFMVSFQMMGNDVDNFVRTVIPLLQQRELFRTDYEGTTLRQHLGLEHPSSMYARHCA